jgi:hypothetical protein
MRAPTGIPDLTPAWLNEALAGRFPGTIVSLEAKRIGTGQVADSVRLFLDWEPSGAGPRTLVAKVSAENETSRAASKLTRTYEVEAGFYRDLQPTLPISTPRCYAALYDPDTIGYVILMDDAAPARQGDQMAGCQVEEAALALDELALLHGPRWGDPALAKLAWLQPQPLGPGMDIGMVAKGFLGQFLERYAARLSPEVRALGERFGDFVQAYRQRDAGPTVVHGDFRVDNLLFGRERVIVVDWQTVTMGPALADVSYFLGGSFLPELRRRNEEALVRRYHEKLRATGVDLSWDDCWSGYRRYAFDGLFMAIVASILVVRTERGDDMFVAMAERSGRHGLDLETEALFR